MSVDNEKFYEDVAFLKEKRVIVKDVEVAEALGTSASNISMFFNRVRAPSRNFIDKFYSHYEKYLTEKNVGPIGNAIQIDLGDKLIMQVPLVSQYAYAGYVTGFADPEYIEQLTTVPFIVEKEPRGTYISFEVSGNSMDDGSSDSYLAGDILLCREIKRELWQSKLHIKKWDFVIVHKSLGVQVKCITKHDTEKGIITLHPLNPEYRDIETSIDEVLQLFNVVQVARKK
jgi:SOS-response transcriptional repressor LexA